MLKLDNKKITDGTKIRTTTRVTKICDSCGSISTPQYRHAKLSHDKWGKDLCRSCSTSKGHQKIKTKYGRKIKAGKIGNYVQLWDERRKRYVGEHHLVVEEITGFNLADCGWYIHHINGIKDDNSPKNLCAVPTNSQHRKLHGQLEQVAFELVRRKVIYFDHDICKYLINPLITLSTTPFSLGFENIAIVQKKAKITSRSEVDISSEIMRGISLSVPIIPSNMSTVTNVEFCILLEKLGSMGVLHRATTDEVLEQWTLELSKHNKLVAVSIGVGVSQFELAKRLIRANANVIFIDVAHGYSNPMIETGKKIKEFAPDVHIVVGNTTHPGLFAESSEFASAVKVGIAQGFACETKNTAGVTEKQFSAIQKCKMASRTYGLPIISDGGIREPADLVKAIAGGASSVMAGKIFAACPESAAPLDKNGNKIYAGMASRFVQEGWHGLVKNNAPEGGIRILKIGESANKLLDRYCGSLRSGISYAGCSNIIELQNNAEFVIINTT